VSSLPVQSARKFVKNRQLFVIAPHRLVTAIHVGEPEKVPAMQHAYHLRRELDDRCGLQAPQPIAPLSGAAGCHLT